MPAITDSTPAPSAGRREHFPPQIKYIVGNEACERFSYYGLAGILVDYMAHQLGMGADHAKEVYHLFGASVYFMPLIGGFLADRYLGRYWTILSVSLFYCLGHGTLFLFGDTRGGVYAGLALIAIGAGGIKPNVSAFVGDQFRPDQSHMLTKVFGWFYWAVNLGAAGAFFIIPYVQEKYGYRWAFGIPGIFMGLATLVFWLGSRFYVRQPPAISQKQNSSPKKPVAPGRNAKAILAILMIFAPITIFWALYNQVNSTWVLQGEQMRPAFGSPLFSKSDFKDTPALVAKLNDKTNTVSQWLLTQFDEPLRAQLAKTSDGDAQTIQPELAAQLNKLISAGSIYETNRFTQVKLSDDSQYLIESNPQGEDLIRLNRLLLDDAYPKEISRNLYIVNGETMQAAGAILVMILVPLFTGLLYPMAEKQRWRPTTLRRMGLGLLLAALSFVPTALIQKEIDQHHIVNILWQIVPYIFLEAGEVLVSATALEFAFSQAPEGTKSIIMSAWFLVNSLGQFVIAAITAINEHVIHAGGVSLLYFYSAMMAFGFVVFVVLSTFYRYRETPAVPALDQPVTN